MEPPARTGSRRPSDVRALARLRADFEGWRFIVSDRRRWWAMRGPLPPDRVNEVDAFDADSAEELRAALIKAKRAEGGR